MISNASFAHTMNGKATGECQKLSGTAPRISPAPSPKGLKGNRLFDFAALNFLKFCFQSQ